MNPFGEAWVRRGVIMRVATVIIGDHYKMMVGIRPAAAGFHILIGAPTGIFGETPRIFSNAFFCQRRRGIKWCS